MFQNLRAGSPIYILHKQEPKLVIGEVTSVSLPTPQYGQSYANGVYTQPKTTVDVKVKVDGDVVDYQKLPSDVSTADFGNASMVISESKDAIINEIEVLKKNSMSIIDSVEYHRGVVSSCSSMIEELNPIARQEAERAKEIDSMKDELREMKEMLARVLKSRKE